MAEVGGDQFERGHAELQRFRAGGAVELRRDVGDSGGHRVW